MKPREAIITFAQSEKIKSALIWATHTVEVYNGCAPAEKAGAAKIIDGLTRMIASEVHFAGKVTREEAWAEVLKSMDMAVVMINSGVIAEASFHLSQAISRVVGISQNAMTFLQNEGLL